VGPTRRWCSAGLESSRLQAWLAGRDLLARTLTVILVLLWALLEDGALQAWRTAGLAGWRGSAGQDVNGNTGLAVGPTRRWCSAGLEPSRLQAWLAGRDLLARMLTVILV